MSSSTLSDRDEEEIQTSKAKIRVSSLTFDNVYMIITSKYAPQGVNVYMDMYLLLYFI